MGSDSDSIESKTGGRRRRRRSRSGSSGRSSDSNGNHSRHRRSGGSRKRSKPSSSRATKGSRSRSRSPSERSSRQRRKSRSRSSSRRRTSSRSRGGRKTGSRSPVSRSSKKEKETGKQQHIITIDLTKEDQLKMKMQQALKAAAEADAQLRQKGILQTSNVAAEKPTTGPSIQEQLLRTQALDEINAPGFQSQEFKSGRTLAPTPSSAGASRLAMDDHSTAIFGMSVIDSSGSITSDIRRPPPAKAGGSGAAAQVFKDNLIHENLFADPASRQENWIRRLYVMRQRRLNGEAMT